MSYNSVIWKKNLLDAKDHIGIRDVLFITFDTLRYDVAKAAMETGQTPFLKRLLPNGAWEVRHTPGSFTYSAHHAFFAGFLPTLKDGRKHERLFALTFPGSETTGARTLTFDAPNIIDGYRSHGYRSLCVGGVGFFNKLTPLGTVLPKLFDQSEWQPKFSVTRKDSAQNQLEYSARFLEGQPTEQRLFLFINLSAMHQPNCIYVDGQTEDSPKTQAAALAAVDKALNAVAPIFEKRKWLCIFTSDHGTAYGEAGYQGHRLAHETVWQVPYAEFLWN